MSLLRRRRVLAAKIEATSGTAEVLAGTDGAMNVYNPIIQQNVTLEEREGQGGFGYLSSIPGGHTGTATFRTYLEWDGTLTEPVWADTFFPACGWVKTGQVFTPRSEAPGANVKTLTIACYVDGIYKQLHGCMGSFVVNLPTGRNAFIDWTFMGVLTEPTALGLLAPTYPTDKPLRYAGGLAEWNDVNMCVESAVITSGNNVIMRECPTSEAGFTAAIVTNRRPTISVNPESATIATQNRWNAFLQQTEFALELDVGGPTGAVTNAVLSFDAPKAQIINLQEGNRNDIVTDEIEFQCNKNGATHDQELSITFTAATA